ncbi:hypothetical protein Tco_1444905, partial [Tanacetum coccineum]
RLLTTGPGPLRVSRKGTNVAGGVQNRSAKDGRVHVVEPRAREALKVSESRKHCGGYEA